ncbi:hypothetical protein [Patulibacter medicamentivorans]|uniref:hypothetical protein n=1 Tax=Patulibacter medicamentivorans TaxID=1097667 RepID=UPI001110C0DF|nr:hypothetical protein [Patulibacter medicamentivorans]
MAEGSDLDRPVGVWRAVGELNLRSLWPEGALGVLIGGGGAGILLASVGLSARVAVAGDLLALGGALVAVVFTALVLVVSIPSNTYIRMLAATSGGGIQRFLDPFLVAVGTQVSVILLAIAYKAAAQAVPSGIEGTAWVLLGTLFVFGLLDIVALARSLVRHGVHRAADAELTQRDDGDGTAPVRRLPRRG